MITSFEDRMASFVAVQKERLAKEAAWWAARTFEDFCPSNPEYCDGFIGIVDEEVAPVGSSPSIYWQCPHADTDCPHARARLRVVMQRHLRGLGFFQRHCTPRLSEVRGVFEEPVRAYISTIDDRVRAGDGLILGSAPGVGKTCILALIAWAAREWNTVYARSLDLHSWLKRSWEHEQSIYNATSTGLLLIDDLGTEFDDGEAQARFHHLIDERCGQTRSTVITTNLFREDVEAMPHMQRVMDRLRSVSPWIEAVGEGSQRPTADWREWQTGGDEA